MKKQVLRKCPRCKTIQDMTYPATSRRDNETEICSQCGTNEALEDFAKSQLKVNK